MLEIGKAIYYVLALTVAGVATAVILRQMRAEVVFLTVGQKMTRSLKVGVMVGVLVVLLFLTFQVYSWDGLQPAMNVRAVLTLIVCLVVPFQIIAVVGTFLQLTFMEFLMRRGLKK